MSKNKKGNLSNQVFVLSVNTGFFYNAKEQQFNEIVRECNKQIIINNTAIKTNKRDKVKGYTRINRELSTENKNLKLKREEAKSTLLTLINSNEDQRELTGEIKPNHIVGMFESTLSRTLLMPTNEVSEDLIIIEIFHQSIMKQMLKDGFIYKNEPYIYFSSSSGQIKKKKCVFMKKSKWEEHMYSLMCGLDIETINNRGGINPNKLLSYMMLANSATTKWNIDLNRVVVIDDMETIVNGEVDYVDDETFKVTREMRDVQIKQTDGIGFCLPSINKRAFMFRGPWMKGLICPVPYDKFKGKTTKVTDVWGREWDIVADRISVILHKSQLKLADYYDSWDDFKEKFKTNKCEMAIGNVEDKYFADATLTYQMLQSLTNVEDDELREIVKTSADKINLVGRDKDVMLNIMGVTKENENKNWLQQAIELYPELMSDVYTRKSVSQTKASYVKKAKEGKVEIPNSKYTYVVPDVTAWMEWLFNDNKEPKGTLEREKVSCKLYEDGNRINCLRSPHLYREHGTKDNVVNDDTKQWFITNCIYVSVDSLLPKLLQYDSDGDKLLIVDNQLFVSVAERNMKGIVPLVYNQRSSEKKIINSDVIYESLKAGFGADIGSISNSLSRAWHSDTVDESVLEEIKILCAINNNEIDYSKTLWRATVPDDVKARLKKHQYGKLPHVFHYAKDKKEKQVKSMGNNTMDRLANMIPNTNIHFVDMWGKCDWKMLVKNPRVKIEEAIIAKYDELNKKKRKQDLMKKGKEADNYMDKYIHDELLKINSNEQMVSDMLVKHLYMKGAENKKTLWNAFGQNIVDALQSNVAYTKQCEGCLCRIERKQGKKYCEKCAVKKEKNRKR